MQDIVRNILLWEFIVLSRIYHLISVSAPNQRFKAFPWLRGER